MIDPEAVRAYCRVVFTRPPPGAFIALRGLPDNRLTEATDLRWLDPANPNWIEGVVEFVRACDDSGLAGYCVPGFVSRYGRAGHADVVSLPTLVIDFDSGDVPANCMRASALLGTPSLAVRSGGRLDATAQNPLGAEKTHLYWRLDDHDPERVCELRGLAAAATGGDPSFGPGRAHQPVRIAGSVHRKQEPTLVTVAYTAESSVNVSDKIAYLKTQTHGQNLGRMNGGPLIEGPQPNSLGLLRQVSLDDLISRKIGHGETAINRFEALTRMAGMMLANIHDTANAEECAREFGYYRQWCISHIENVERDYDLALHWRRLLRRERWKREQPRRPRARPRYMNR
jgi:hypothetical protein